MSNHNDYQDYQSAYQTLAKNAEFLENAQELDIDNLMNVVEESIHAYQFCEARITAVEQALNQIFNNADQP